MPAAIQCPNCQKEYPWKPELAGKRVKCKCGEIIEVPSAAPKAEVDELYDLADDPAPKGQHGITDLQSAATTAAVAVDRSGQFACPYCGEKLDAGAMMCVFCGSNLEGSIPETPVTPLSSAMQSAPPVAAKPVVMKTSAPDEQTGKTRLMLLSVVAMVIVIAGILVIRRYLPKPPTAGENLRPADAAIVDKLDHGIGSEARDWLKNNDTRTLSGLNRRQSQAKVDQWYELGARRVIVFTNGSSVALELPGEIAKRHAIFDWEKKWNTDNNFKVATDQGQRWLEVEMHL